MADSKEKWNFWTLNFFKLSTLLNNGRINSERLQKRYSSLGKGGESRSNEMPLRLSNC